MKILHRLATSEEVPDRKKLIMNTITNSIHYEFLSNSELMQVQRAWRRGASFSVVEFVAFSSFCYRPRWWIRSAAPSKVVICRVVSSSLLVA